MSLVLLAGGVLTAFCNNEGHMSQKRRIDKSSTTAAVQSFAGVMSDVPLPNGIEQRSDLERTI